MSLKRLTLDPPKPLQITSWHRSYLDSYGWATVLPTKTPIPVRATTQDPHFLVTPTRSFMSHLRLEVSPRLRLVSLKTKPPKSVDYLDELEQASTSPSCTGEAEHKVRCTPSNSIKMLQHS